ncbi:MAG: peptidylprolyl isomerase [Saprospiraceae bacterium]|nr:peptidylprolyl isomerase [Saprospiraceae bacterium]MCB0622904.1 peptidylprolyl isomerase [Saprospiraceae bacterium]MCB0679845.1 peptidylprolyl isomerase [Saprospiraceae bacterium]
MRDSFRLRGAALLPALLLTFSLFGQRKVIDQVVATVGSEIVLLSDVEERKALVAAQQGNLPENADCFILDNILSEKLLVNQAKIDSVVVSDEEVEAQLDARIDQILAYMNNDYRQFEDYYGQSVNEVKEEFREDLRNQLLAQRLQGEVVTGTTVTPSEVKAFFNRIPTDSIPYFDSEVEVREIVLRPKISEEQRQLAIDKLTNIRQRIVEGGEDFAELAKVFSDDFGSARIGGDLGWTKRGKFVPEFEAAAYKLDEGEVSKIIESEFGFHLIQLLERRGNTIHTRHILVKPEIMQADLEKAERLLDSVRSLIISDSISFSRAVKSFGSDEFQSFNNDGRMVNPQTGNTFFEIGDLDPDVFFTIDTLKVDEVSKPFPFEYSNGETYFRIVQLQSRTDPHRASLEQDYAKIQAAAIEEKTSRYLDEWLLEKVYSTFISIDQRFGDCEVLNKWKRPDRP